MLRWKSTWKWMKPVVLLGGLIGILAVTPDARATEFNTLRPDLSRISFAYQQMNVPVEGTFKRFNGWINFDPAKPALSKAQIDIALASIDVGSDEANDEVAGKLWFNTKAYPVARFVVSVVKPLGNNRFDVLGKMTIKGRTLDADAPVTFRQEGIKGIFDGTFVLRRADYGIGEGMWADFDTVANIVQINFRLVALAAAKQ
jgi:polyisoprenoid-binding protein YceI